MSSPTGTQPAEAPPLDAAGASDESALLNLVKASLGTQQPTSLAAITFVKDGLKKTFRPVPGAKTANLSSTDAHTLHSVMVWLEQSILLEAHNPASTAVEQRLSTLAKSIDRNTTELEKVRASLVPRPTCIDEADDELLVDAELGPSTSSAPRGPGPDSWAVVARRQRTAPLKVPLEQRMAPAECLLKRSGTADPDFAALTPAQKVTKLRESIIASLPSGISGSAVAEADINKLVRAVRPLPSGDLIVVSASAALCELLKQHAPRWLPMATPSLGLHSPSWGVVVHRVPTTFNPQNPSSVAGLRAGNEDVIPAAASIAWLSRLPNDSSKKHGSLLIQLPCAAQANTAIQQGVAYDGRLLRVEKVMRSPPQCWRCQRYGHVSLQCRQAPRCATCAGPHLTKNCACPAEEPCASTTTCTHVSPKCANCNEGHTAASLSCPSRRLAFDNAKERALRSGELYSTTSSPSS